MKKIGFIGVGVMGKSMVLNLMKKGFEVSIYARNKQKIEDILKAGAIFCDTIESCVQNKDAVITIVGYPKDVEAFIDEEIDLVVTVCDNAKESCPIFPRPVPRIHLPFHDPHGESLESFAKVRNDIRARLVPAVREALGLKE